MSRRAVQLGRVAEYFHQTGIPFIPNAILTVPMLREHASGFFSDNIKPAWLLKQMDYAAVTVGRTYLRPFGEALRVLTRGLPEVRVFQPVTVLDELETLAWPVRLGNSSMVVRVEGYASRRENRERRRCFEALFVLVAYDPEQKKTIAFPRDQTKVPLQEDVAMQRHVTRLEQLDKLLENQSSVVLADPKLLAAAMDDVSSSRFGLTRHIRPVLNPMEFAASHRTLIGTKEVNLMRNLHGGEMLRMMADVSFSVAAKYYQTQKVVTVGMSHIDIKKSAKEGWYVVSKARMVALTPHRMVVEVKLLASDLGDIRHQIELATGYFYLRPELPLGQIFLPELDLSDSENRKLFVAGMLRLQLMQNLWQER